MAHRLNVIYLHSHDTGRYLRPYGCNAQTPALQQLAEQGVLFRKAFCAAPTCSPSRAALLTGQWPHQAGMLGLAHRGFRMSDESHHLANVLLNAGYITALSGIQHVTGNPTGTGYRHILCKGKDSEAISTAACRYLDTADDPFFLDVGFFDTHREFPEADAADVDYSAPPAILPDSLNSRLDWAGFLASARRLDSGVARVLEQLERRNLADHTIVLYTTDHGVAFPGMKCNLTDHGIGVAAMLRGPGIASRTVTDAMISHVDFMPTLLELTGVSQPDWLAGHSLVPLLAGAPASIREELFAEVTFHAAYEPQRCIRTKRYKYIRRFGPHANHLVRPNCDDGAVKRTLLAAGWADRLVAEEQLFDLLFDPTECVNLASNDSHAEIRSRLRRQLDDWMKDTVDPLLNGDVAVPKGAVVNLFEQVNPDEPTAQA